MSNVVEKQAEAATETQTVNGVGKGKGKRGPRVSMQDFIIARTKSESLDEMADMTGLTPASIQARCSKYRSLGIPIEEFPRGGGAKLDVEAAQKLLAELQGRPVEEVQAEAEEWQKKQAERQARKAEKETEETVAS